MRALDDEDLRYKDLRECENGMSAASLATYVAVELSQIKEDGDF